jgi:hypothetical protein
MIPIVILDEIFRLVDCGNKHMNNFIPNGVYEKLFEKSCERIHDLLDEEHIDKYSYFVLEFNPVQDESEKTIEILEKTSLKQVGYQLLD